MTLKEDPADEYRKSLRQWTALWGGLGGLCVGLGIETGDPVAILAGAGGIGLAALAVYREYRDRQRWRATDEDRSC